MNLLLKGNAAPVGCGVRSARAAALAGLLLGMHLCQDAGGAELVISQIYGGGGNSGASYRNDFIELFNRGTNPLTFTNWSVQYASASGSNWLVTTISGSVPPGGYFLIQEGSGGANGLALPAPDAAGTISMSGTAGKLALVAGVLPLNNVCPARADILDFVGYGTSANCFEGAGPAPAPSNSTAALRASGGCGDMGDNSTDFFSTSPAPRNSVSSANLCASIPSEPRALHVIQGSGALSPLSGQLVSTTTNIVTALRADGFFLQARDEEADDDPNTSEALFVAAPGGVPPTAARSNAVVVSGIVSEQRPASDPGGPTRTQLINTTMTLISSGNPLPSAVTLTAADSGPTGPADQLERFEAMRVRVSSLTVVAATKGFVIESDAIGVSDGVFFGVVTGVARPFREPGIPLLDPLPQEAPPGVPRFDTNPERLRVDSNAQLGASRIEVTAGAVVSDLIGVLDFESRHYTILPDPASGLSVSGNSSAIPVPVAATNEFTVASLNLQRFYDTADDAATLDVVLTTNAFLGRVNKASLAIRNVLRSPDVLGVVEMENLTTLQTLADRLNSDAIAAGQSGLSYAAHLVEGNDIGGIDVGYLVNTARVSVVGMTQVGATSTYLNPLNGSLETLHDRPPLVMRAAVARPGGVVPLPFTAVLVHLRSLRDIEDPGEGPRVRAKRRAQAEFVASLIQQRQAADPSELILCLGDFNAYAFNDGYVDMVGTIVGRPAPANEVTTASADLVNPDLFNLSDNLPPSERYSYVFDGSAQAIDHLLVNAPLRSRVNRFAYARCNADFPESFRGNTNRAERLSDHDAPVAFISLVETIRLTSIVRASANEVRLEWTGPRQREMAVVASTSLGTWSEIGRATANGDGFALFTDTNAVPGGQRFYRVLAL